MAHAYTPGLKVTENQIVRKRRVLPLQGELVVEKGQHVKPDTIVARTFLPGKVTIVNVANKLGVDQSEVPSTMLKKEGDPVKEGEIIALSKSFFGLFKSEAESPMDGTLESVSGVTGQVVVRGEPEPVQVAAYLEGEVIEVLPGEGVIVETAGAFIQGIFGIGGETFGSIAMVTDSPRDILGPDRVKPEHQGKIIAGGNLVTFDALKKAIKLGVKGVVVGGFDDKDLREFLGYDLGVAITGHEDLGITLIVTEGFGQINMAPGTFNLLKTYEGYQASINGATQIRAGVIRPEVIIPNLSAKKAVKPTAHILGMKKDSPIRVIRAPYFGMLGKVISLPPELRRLESETRARVVEVELENGKRCVLPRANVELIEE
ncbi:MAG: hypothetical protein JW797_12540 [Bradymonadales bacterium]|nr:hypothetical protein [Bradymonadales bacterium]